MMIVRVIEKGTVGYRSCSYSLWQRDVSALGGRFSCYDTYEYALDDSGMSRCYFAKAL